MTIIQNPINNLAFECSQVGLQVGQHADFPTFLGLGFWLGLTVPNPNYNSNVTITFPNHNRTL